MNENDNIGLKDLLELCKVEGINPQLKTSEFGADYHAQMDRKTPVLVQVLMFVGAMLAAGFFLGFLGIIGLLYSEGSMLVFGVIITGFALAIPYISKQETIIEPFGLATMIVGTSLFAAGYTFMGRDSFVSFLMLSFILSVVIAFVAGSHLQKISAILCANACLYGLIWEMEVLVGYNFQVLFNATIITVAWLREPDLLSVNTKLGAWYAAVLNGCSVSMVAVLIGSVNAAQDWHWRGEEVASNHWWLSSIMLVGLVLWTLNDTLDLVGERKKKLPIIVGAGLGLMILIAAPGIVAGILLLFLGIYSGYRLFVVQGILAIFFFTVMFYYNLETSFFIKSFLMTGSGIVFLLIGYFLKLMHDREAALVTQN